MEITSSDILAIIKGLDTMADVSSIKSDTLLEEAGLDSLDRMNLFLDIEEKFNVKISDDDFNQLNSIKDIIKFCKEK